MAAHSTKSSRSDPYSLPRSPPYYMEIREYRFSKDELRRKDHKSPTKSPHSSSNATFTQQSHAYPLSTQGNVHHLDEREYSVWKASGLCRRSSEYEDIYNTRFRKGDRASYGRHSFREERNARRHRGIDGDLRDSPNTGRTREISDTRNMDGRRNVVSIEDGWYTRDKRDTTDMRDPPDVKYLDKTKNKKESKGKRYTTYEPGVSNIRDTRYTEEQTSTNDARNKGNTEETREYRDYQLSEEIRSARQTSFPRDLKQEAVGNPESSRVPRNVNMRAIVASSSSNDSRSSPKTCKQPPPILPKPVRPKPQNTRPASPAPSGHTSVSDASSQATRHSAQSAASEKSVKSILKKPRVGRLVLKEEPSSFTLLAVVSCILCFPFGIYALTKSKQVKTAVEENDYESALSSSKKVKSFCIGVAIAYLGIFSVGGGLLAKYLVTGKLF